MRNQRRERRFTSLFFFRRNSDSIKYNVSMKLKNLLLMTLILSLLAGSTYYLASKQDKPEPCEAVTETRIYLALRETYPLEEEEYEISDGTVLSVEDGKIIGLSKGEAMVSAGCR